MGPWSWAPITEAQLWGQYEALYSRNLSRTVTFKADNPQPLINPITRNPMNHSNKPADKQTPADARPGADETSPLPYEQKKPEDTEGGTCD